MSVGLLEMTFALVVTVGAWLGFRTGLASLLFQIAGAILGLSIGRWAATVFFTENLLLGLPLPWLVGVLAPVGAIGGALVGRLLAVYVGSRLVIWAPHADRWSGAVVGLLAGGLLWGTLYMGLLTWSWQPWTRLAHYSLAGTAARYYMPIVYLAIDRAFPAVK